MRGVPLKYAIKEKLLLKPPLFHLFMIGFCLGIVLINFFRKTLIDESGLLDEYTLYHLKYITIDSNVFFVYVLKERITSVLMLLVFATTYLGIVVVWGYTIWMGMSAGMLLSICAMRYGVKGIILAVIGIFPQQICFVPACIFLLLWCYELCANIYFPSLINSTKPLGLKQNIIKKTFMFGIIVAVIVLGCFLESYVNPQFLIHYLKIF